MQLPEVPCQTQQVWRTITPTKSQSVDGHHTADQKTDGMDGHLSTSFAVRAGKTLAKLRFTIESATRKLHPQLCKAADAGNAFMKVNETIKRHATKLMLSARGSLRHDLSLREGRQVLLFLL